MIRQIQPLENCKILYCVNCKNAEKCKTYSTQKSHKISYALFDETYFIVDPVMEMVYRMELTKNPIRQPAFLWTKMVLL